MIWKTRLTIAATLVAFATQCVGGASAQPTQKELFAILESGRGSGVDAIVRNTVTVHNPGEDPVAREYRVLSNADGRSIVEFLDEAERGMKILNTDGDVWLFTPRTRRAIKVPPAQRLFGDASIGDILQIQWTQDYLVSAPPEPVVEASDQLWRITMSAQSDAATYRGVQMWVRQTSLMPVRTEYFLASGKLNKSGVYARARIEGGRFTYDSLTLTGPSKPGRKTVISIESIEIKDLPDNWFTRVHLETSR